MKASAAVIECPSQEKLRLLISGQLDGNDFALIETHVESCTECQGVLARLSDGALTADWWKTPSGAKSDADTTNAFVARIKRTLSGAADVSLPPGTMIGEYELVRELGHGGMGVVYLAQDQQLGHSVALKVLKPSLAAQPRERERFFREGRAAAAVKHDHIVTVHAANTTADLMTPYLVMEYVEGEALDRVLRKRGALPPRECAQLVQQAAWGLAAAHAKGLVHRDVKPSNLMCEDGTGRVKVMDFGLVRRLDGDEESLTRAGDIVGTAVYMSPEHITRPDKVNAVSDVFSLGVVLYELMTGERPFVGRPHMILQQVVHSEPKDPRQWKNDIPIDLGTICLKCLRKAPSDRYASAQALADDLSRFLAREPIAARPVTQRERMWMWCRRNPWLAFSTAACAAAALLAAGFYGMFREQVSIAASRQTTAQTYADVSLSTMKRVIETVERNRSQFPASSSIRIDLVKGAIEDLDKLKGIVSTSGTTERAVALRYWRLLSELHREIGNTAAAWEYLSKAHEIGRQRIKDQNGSTASLLNLAETYGDMASLRQDYQRDLPAAIRFAQEGADLYGQALKTLPPNEPGKLRMEAMAKQAQLEHVAGTQFMRLGDPKRALEAFEAALKARERILEEPQFRRLPAALQENVERDVREKASVLRAAAGDMYFRLGRREEAIDAYTKALSTAEAIFERFPDAPTAKRQLGNMASQAGYFHMLIGDLEKADSLLRKAVELLEKLAEADSQNVEYQIFLALAHYRLGTLLKASDPAESWRHLEACLEIRERLAKDEVNVSRQRQLLLALARCEELGDAERVERDLLARNASPDIELLLDLARADAQRSAAMSLEPSQQQRYLAQAQARLEQAFKLGHRDPVTLEHEPDLIPLRSTEAFQALLKKGREAIEQAQRQPAKTNT